MSSEEPLTRPQRTAFGSGEWFLAETCRLSAVLQTPEPEGPKPWLWWGIYIHRFLEYAKLYGRDEALAYIVRKYPRAARVCSRIDTDAIPPGDVEVGYAHATDLRTVRRFRYPDRPDRDREVGGRADLVLVEELHIADYKSGANPGDPAESSQVIGLLLARRLETGQLDRPGKGSLVGVRRDGRLIWRTAEWSAGELDGLEERLVTTHLRVLDDRKALAGGEPAPRAQPGTHCWAQWCAHRYGCAAAGPEPTGG